MYFFIAILTLISFAAFKIYQSIKVPEGLKNVPAFSFLHIFISIFNKTGPGKRWKDKRQVLEKEGIGRVIFSYLFNHY